MLKEVTYSLFFFLRGCFKRWGLKTSLEQSPAANQVRKLLFGRSRVVCAQEGFRKQPLAMRSL